MAAQIALMHMHTQGACHQRSYKRVSSALACTCWAADGCCKDRAFHIGFHDLGQAKMVNLECADDVNAGAAIQRKARAVAQRHKRVQTWTNRRVDHCWCAC
jgi:hypothetical protein